MNIVSSSSSVSSNSIFSSFGSMLNTTLKITVAAVAITALFLLGAILLKACYNRFISAKALPSSLNSSSPTPIQDDRSKSQERSTSDQFENGQSSSSSSSSSSDLDLPLSKIGSGPNTPYSDGPTTPERSIDSSNSDILSHSSSSSTLESSSDVVGPEQLRSSALEAALTRLRASEVVDFSAVGRISRESFNAENGFSCSIAFQPNFRGLNRYSNIVPWDHNLCRKSDIGEDGSESNYVNASHIDLGDQSFIATDAPTYPAMGPFWNMVWDQDVKVMVNLTEVIEQDRYKADKYWIEGRDKEQSLSFGDPEKDGISITLQEETCILPSSDDEIDLKNFSDELYFNNTRTQYIVKRTFNLTKQGVTKTVIHYHYRHWPDHGAPQSDEEKACFLKLVNGVAGSSPANPILVHCSAGVGRTGTFLAVCHARQQQLAGVTLDRPELAAGETVLRMRSQRSGMIQAPVQFNFITEMMRQPIHSS